MLQLKRYHREAVKFDCKVSNLIEGMVVPLESISERIGLEK